MEGDRRRAFQAGGWLIGQLIGQLARRSAGLAYRFRWPRVVADHREIYLSAKRAGAERRQDAQVGVASRMN